MKMHPNQCHFSNLEELCLFFCIMHFLHKKHSHCQAYPLSNCFIMTSYDQVSYLRKTQLFLTSIPWTLTGAKQKKKQKKTNPQ